MIKNVFYSILIVLVFCEPSFSQLSTTPAQITGLPMYYIPSFAGNLGRVRVASENFYKYSDYNKTFSTMVSVDGFVPKLSSGVGFFLGYDNYSNKPGTGYDYHSNYSSMGFIFAPKISIKGKYTLSPGLSLTGNNVHKYMGEHIAAVYDPKNFEPHYVDFSAKYVTQNKFTEKASLLFNTKKFYIGAAFNCSVKKLSLWNIILQTGATFQRTDESKFSFSPNVVWSQLYSREIYYYTTKRTLHQYSPTNVNLNFRYQKVLFGLNYYSFMVGFQHKNFRVMYNTNIKLTQNTITLRLLFSNKESKRSNF